MTKKILTEAEKTARHNMKMAKKKAVRDKMIATKTEEKGLIIVHTGKGKGKSTAAFGMVFRAIGHKQKVAVVQFIKGAWETGERDVLAAFSDYVDVFVEGEGFTWETQDRDRDIAAAQKGWERAKKCILSGDYKMVLLDELNIALRYDYIDLADVLLTLENKPEDVHVVVTGRNAKDALIEIADLVTEMTQIKHPFRSGVKAQACIEF
ncbi:MAG: cob(I)yrinic acid a,c-diamide adenosyltransferase [Rhizobiales bacterium]|nr:cob(I)yrinic acid a,c-diamide adenosyltransferase [Hyphomicrobiales bacterium]